MMKKEKEERRRRKENEEEEVAESKGIDLSRLPKGILPGNKLRRCITLCCFTCQGHAVWICKPCEKVSTSQDGDCPHIDGRSYMKLLQGGLVEVSASSKPTDRETADAEAISLELSDILAWIGLARVFSFFIPQTELALVGFLLLL